MPPATRDRQPRARSRPTSSAHDRLLLLEEGHCLRDQALAFCSLRRVDNIDTFGASSLSTLVQMVANGLGLTLLPEIALDVEARDERVNVMRFADPEPSRTIGLAWRRPHRASATSWSSARSSRDSGARMIAAVIGAGPAGLMAAEVLRNGGADVTVYDRMPSAGRKFLMAGRGGLNLTHSEELEPFMSALWDGGRAIARRHRGVSARRLAGVVRSARPADIRRIERARVSAQHEVVAVAARVAARLDAAGVRFAFRHRWSGWDEKRLAFSTPEGPVMIDADATVLALGGASWPRLGRMADGADILANAGVAVSPLKPSNSGFWPMVGSLQKPSRASRSSASRCRRRSTVRGEAIITESGIEGGAVYALSPALRRAIEATAKRSCASRCDPDA